MPGGADLDPLPNPYPPSPSVDNLRTVWGYGAYHFRLVFNGFEARTVFFFGAALLPLLMLQVLQQTMRFDG